MSCVETDADKAARIERRVKAEAAASRADQLLISFLEPSQAESYKRDRRFDVPVGDRIYRIHKGRAGNVHLIENGKPVAKLCAHPAVWTPDGDTMLAQLLMIKTNEAEFLKTANRTAI